MFSLLLLRVFNVAKADDDREYNTLIESIKIAKSDPENRPAIFLFSRIGDDEEAKDQLNNLQNNEDVKHSVYCSKEKLDKLVADTGADTYNPVRLKAFKALCASSDGIVLC